jgi:hypothetical protein
MRVERGGDQESEDLADFRKTNELLQWTNLEGT